MLDGNGGDGPPEASGPESGRDVLRELRRRVGDPSYQDVARAGGADLSKSTVQNLVVGSTKPRLASVAGFIRGCLALARQRRRLSDLAEEQWLDRYWLDRYRRAVSRPEPVDGNSPPSPAGLPSPIGSFVGRTEAVRELLGRIEAPDPSGTGPAVHVIDGMPGVGKTELALYVARQVAHRFRDGVVFLDLAGHSSDLAPIPPTEALRILLGQRGVPVDPNQPEAGLRALWRNECARHKLLIILDNARDRSQVTPLLPDTPGCLVLVTTREKLIGLPGVEPFPLDVFEAAEATELLLASAEENEPDGPAVRRVVEVCDRLPLAIAIAASMLAHRPGYRMTELADDLEAERRYLQDLDEHDGSLRVAVHASIRLSYRHLSPELVDGLRLCGWHPGPEVTEPALAAMLTDCQPGNCVVELSDRTVRRARRLLLALADRNLIRWQSTDRSRYRMHDLVRDSVRLSHADRSEDERLEALAHLNWAYLATLEHAESWRYGRAPDLRRIRPEDAPLATFADQAAAVSWVLRERENALALVNAMDCRSAFVSSVLGAQLRDRGFLPDARHCYADAEAGYGLMGLDDHRAHALRGLAQVASLTGDHAAARRDYNRARDVSRRRRDEFNQALALRGLGAVARTVDDYDGATVHLRRAISMLAAHPEVRAGNPLFAREYAVALAEYGQVEKARGRLDHATALLSEAHQVHGTTGDLCAQHAVMTGLAEIRRIQGDPAAARIYLDEVLRSVREIHDPSCEANALWELGQLLKAAGEPIVAIATFERGLALKREYGTPFGAARALLGLADAERLAGRLDRARDHFNEALRSCLGHDDRDGVAQAGLGLGDVALATGDRVLAERCWQRALDVGTEIGLALVIEKARGRLAGLGA